MRRRFGINFIAVMMSIMLAFCLSGCAADIEEMTDEESAAAGIYRIYCVNPDETALVRHDYKAESETFDGILNEILGEFRHPSVTDAKTALPERVEINSATAGINEIDVDFNAEYLSLDTISELLLRSALVKTLLPLQGVDSVRFTVESQNLVIGDEEIGPMTKETFIVPTGKGINSYRNTVLSLYFPSADGTSIIRENRTGYYSSNVNTERLVIEQMLKGPEGNDLLPVAVEGTLVQDVTVSNGYCIVDFSEEINSAPAGDVIVNPETVLYAFTDAIIESCAQDKITGVRFRINGSSDERFRDQVNLDQVFTWNPDLIYMPVVKLEESEAKSS